MAITQDTRALVAAQLTNAWAARMGQATPDEAGTVGPTLLAVYKRFLADLAEPEPDMQSWIDTLKGQ